MKKKLASEQRKTKKQDKQLIVAKAKLEESQAETEKEKNKNMILQRANTKTMEKYYYMKNEYLTVVSLTPQAFADRVGEPNEKMHDWK